MGNIALEEINTFSKLSATLELQLLSSESRHLAADFVKLDRTH